MTHREIMGLHAEILALCKTLGISYKDASHQLYMAEWKKLKTDERTQKAFSILTKHTGGALEKLQTQLGKLGIQEGTSTNVDANAAIDANACH